MIEYLQKDHYGGAKILNYTYGMFFQVFCPIFVKKYLEILKNLELLWAARKLITLNKIGPKTKKVFQAK